MLMHVMGVVDRAKNIANVSISTVWHAYTVSIKFFFRILFFWFLFASFALAIYAWMYVYVLPVCEVEHELYFDYRSSSPTTSVFVGETTVGYPYDINVLLNLPESPVNKENGMVMVNLDLYGGDGQILYTSARPIRLHFRSELLSIFRTVVFLPLFLTGWMEERQTHVLPMMSGFVVHSDDETVLKAVVSLSHPTLELYSAKLVFNAHLTGLAYYLQNHFVVSSFILISAIFLLQVLVYGSYATVRFVRVNGPSIWRSSLEVIGRMRNFFNRRRVDTQTRFNGAARDVHSDTSEGGLNDDSFEFGKEFPHATEASSDGGEGSEGEAPLDDGEGTGLRRRQQERRE